MLCKRVQAVYRPVRPARRSAAQCLCTGAERCGRKGTRFKRQKARSVLWRTSNSWAFLVEHLTLDSHIDMSKVRVLRDFKTLSTRFSGGVHHGVQEERLQGPVLVARWAGLRLLAAVGARAGHHAAAAAAPHGAGRGPHPDVPLPLRWTTRHLRRECRGICLHLLQCPRDRCPVDSYSATTDRASDGFSLARDI